MIEQLVLLLIYIGILIYIIRAKKSLVSLYLVIIWIIVILFGILYRNSAIYYEGKQSMTLYPHLFLAFCFLIYIKPLFDVRLRKPLDLRKSYYFRIFLNICAFIAIIPFIENLIHSINASQSTSAFADFYSSKDDIGFDGRAHMSFLGSKLNSITLIFQNVSPLLFIYYMTLDHINKFTAIGLLVFALNPIVFLFALGGRGIPVIVLLWSIALYLLLKRHIPYNRKKIIVTSFAALSVFVGMIVAIITISRFGETDFELSDWIIRYLGESTIGYNEEVFYTRDYTHGDNCLSYFQYILGLNESPDRNIPYLERITGCRMFVFYTFIGDLIIDFGPIITFLIIFILNRYLSNIVKKCNNNSRLSILIIISLYIKMGIIGYMFMFTKLGPQYIMSALIFAFILGIYELMSKRVSI